MAHGDQWSAPDTCPIIAQKNDEVRARFCQAKNSRPSWFSLLRLKINSPGSKMGTVCVLLGPPSCLHFTNKSAERSTLGDGRRKMQRYGKVASIRPHAFDSTHNPWNERRPSGTGAHSFSTSRAVQGQVLWTSFWPQKHKWSPDKLTGPDCESSAEWLSVCAAFTAAVTTSFWSRHAFLKWHEGSSLRKASLVSKAQNAAPKSPSLD